jgi:hypothetical protein
MYVIHIVALSNEGNSFYSQKFDKGESDRLLFK